MTPMALQKDRSAHCCLCGEPRRVTQSPVNSFDNGVECVTIGNHRELKPGRWEQSPQLLVSVSMWRNGGTDAFTHMCDGCIVVGLKSAKTFVDNALESLQAGEPA